MHDWQCHRLFLPILAYSFLFFVIKEIMSFINLFIFVQVAKMSIRTAFVSEYTFMALLESDPGKIPKESVAVKEV